MAQRRWIVGAVVFLMTALIGFVVYQTIWDTYVPPAAGYEVVEPNQIVVGFCGATADTISGTNLSEDQSSVRVFLTLRKHDQFEHGTAIKVTFTLRGPLGERAVRDQNGNAVPRTSRYLCPG